MKLFNVFSADGKFIGSWTALGPEDAITKAKEAVRRHIAMFETKGPKEPFVAKLFR